MGGALAAWRLMGYAVAATARIIGYSDCKVVAVCCAMLCAVRLPPLLGYRLHKVAAICYLSLCAGKPLMRAADGLCGWGCRWVIRIARLLRCGARLMGYAVVS